MFLMIRCSRYVRASEMRVKLLSSSWGMWSLEIIMLYRSACELTIPSVHVSGWWGWN